MQHKSRLLYPFVLMLILTFSIGHAKENEHIPILLIAETPEALSVDFRSGGRLARNLILLGGLLNAAIEGTQKSSESSALRKVVGDFDRRTIVERSFRGGFTSQPVFQLDIAAKEEFGTVDDPDFRKISAGGYTHVMLVSEEGAGMITAFQMSTLSAFTTLHYRLIDTSSEKVLAEDRISGFSNTKFSFEEATSKRAPFINGYPHAVGGAVGRIIGDLRKNGYLSLIASQQGLEDKIPDNAKIMAAYEDHFSYVFAPPKGWQRIDMNTKYVTVISPTEDMAFYGLNITFDLLIEEFGQKFDDVNDYVPVFLKRVQAAGYTIIDNRFPAFDLREQYETYTIRQKDSGVVNVVLFRKLNDDFIVIYTVVITKEAERLFDKYKKDVETIINSGRIETR